MRSGIIGLIGALMLVSAMATSGCSSSSSTSGGGGATANGGSSTVGGNTGTSTVSCTSVSPCGGNVVGTWNVTSSCLKVSGDLDITLASAGCQTVPATGFLQTTGTWTANADGSYTDGTTTKGSITFQLSTACLTVSSVPVACDRMPSGFEVLGWSSGACAVTNGTCTCTLNTNLKGGLGLVNESALTSGYYAASGSNLRLDDTSDYPYCVSGNTLTVTPPSTSLTGTIVLQKQETTGTGGATSTGGAGAGGSNAGGAPPATGGIPGGGQPNNTGGKTGAGGAFTGGVTSAGGASSAGGGASSAGGGIATGGKNGTGVGGGAAGGAGPTGGSSAQGGSTATGGMSAATGGATTNGTMPTLPCDIYAAANNTCVAAHSTIRLLVGSYSGALYQVYRASDKTTKDISALSGTIYADSSVQDTFCQGTTCTITKVYDQSGHGNFVEAETSTNPVSSVGGYQGETAANATADKLTVGGHSVYSLYTNTKQAYWRNGSASGMPLGSAPQGIYMVTSGTHFNTGCCYDYGNGETSRTYVAGPSMDSLYFGASTQWAHGTGSGPWIMADMEDGMVIGNSNTPSITYKFVTAIEKNNGTTEWALRGGDATTGSLTTGYKGALPAGKNPMKKQGSIVLGSGGDCCYSNNNGSAGTFYEGAIVSGYPSDATEDAVQVNIVAAQYGK